MDRSKKTVSTVAPFKASPTKRARPTGDSTEEKDGFIFGWESTAWDELTYEARAIVDNCWPDTATPDIVNGVWDNTPIMQAVLVALKRGVEIGQGSPVATS